MKQIRQYAKLTALVAFVALGLLFFRSNSVSAASLSVDSLADTAVQDDGECTLREAINNVNSASDTTDGGGGGDCAAGDGSSDAITLPAGPIVLSSDLPTVTAPVAISGLGMGQSTVDGDSLWRVFQSTADLQLSDLTITGAMDFGALTLDGDATILRVEVDGDGWAVSDQSGASGALVLGNNNATSDHQIQVHDVYIHNFDVDVAQFFALGIAGAANNSIDFEASRITISDITNTGIVQSVLVGSGLFDGGAGTGVASGELSNLTISDVTSTTNMATGVVLALITQDTSSAEITIRNVTITGLSGSGTSPFLPLGSYAAGIAVAGSGGTYAGINVNVRNVLIAGNGADFTGCALGNINPVTGFSGEVDASITSLGGNVINDQTCSGYFTELTDQNGLTNLADFLDSLADNGGEVPTIALLEGSPAINAGVNDNNVAEDARGEPRPQGHTHDAGSYESAFNPVADLSVSKELLNTGRINSGDTVTYRITITNSGESTTGGGLSIVDMVPVGLVYQGADGAGGDNTCGVATEDGDIKEALPNHTDLAIVLCDGLPGGLAPGRSYSYTMRFTAQAGFADGSVNYVFLTWKDGTEEDRVTLEAFNEGDDIIDEYNNGILTGYNNIASARYSASASLANTGSSGYAALLTAVAAVTVGAALVGLRTYRRV